MIKIIERWIGYYGKLLNEENPRRVLGDGMPNEGLTPAINREEIEVGLKGMKKLRGDGTRWNVSGGLEESRTRRGRYVVGSAPEDF